MRQAPIIAVAIAFAMATLVPACSKSPTTPAPAATIDRLELVGLESVPPGGTVQFHALARLTDGSTRLVTSEALWDSTQPSRFTVSRDGLVTGHERGEGDLRTFYRALQATKRVMVLPVGTFKVSGRVLDGMFAIDGARVEVTAGAAAGLSASSTGGRYALYGVAGETEIRVTKDHYHPRQEHLVVSAHHILDIGLTPVQALPDLSGTYVLAIEAAPECRGPLPREAWTRRYSAVLTRATASRVAVRLGGAEFVTGAESFGGEAAGATILFALRGPTPSESFYYYEAEVMERIAPSIYYVPFGEFEVTAAGSGLSGAFRGTIEVREGERLGWLAVTGACTSANHTARFTR